MNVEGAVLKLLLHVTDKEKSLKYYADLRSDYFSPAFKPILQIIKEYYELKGSVPNYQELELFRTRNDSCVSALRSLELIKCDGVDIELAISELENQHAQNLTLDLIGDMLNSITLLDKDEILEKLSSLPLKLEEHVVSNNKVFSIKDIQIFKEEQEFQKTRIYSGICDAWDLEGGAYYRQELILLGGKRGSGKSIVCANLCCQQHLQGKPSIYFTIEMTAEEVMKRILGMLAGVDAIKIRNNTLEPSDHRLMCEKMATLFHDGDIIFKKHFENNPAPNPVAFQAELQSVCEEKDEGRIIIVDDRELSVATIDTKLATYKARYGDELGVAVVDYLNQTTIDNDDQHDMYDWKPQMVVAKLLKNLTRKYDLTMFSPYQTDDEGGARLAKGILDSPDLCQFINADNKESGVIIFETKKARSADDTGKYPVSIDWKTLAIDPKPVDISALEPQEEDLDDEPRPISGSRDL